MIHQGETMKVKEIMTRVVLTCTPGTSLAEAAGKMWEADCGVLPTLSDSRVVGMITDRDIAIAVATKGRTASEITVGEVLNADIHACHEEEDLETALEIMGREQVRRLPVVNDEGDLRGILSMNDLVLLTVNERSRGSAGLSQAVLAALREISRDRREAAGDELAEAATAGGRQRSGGRR